MQVQELLEDQHAIVFIKSSIPVLTSTLQTYQAVVAAGMVLKRL